MRLHCAGERLDWLVGDDVLSGDQGSVGMRKTPGLSCLTRDAWGAAIFLTADYSGDQ